MRRRTLVALSAAQLAALVASGCTRDEPRDRTVASGSAEPTRRDVSRSPSTTEAMFAVGAGQWLVGRSSQCDRPPEAKQLPSVGGFANPNVEVIVGLRPTLVLGSRGPAGPSLEQALRGHDIATWFPPTDGVEQIVAMIRELGKRVDAKAKADEVARQVEARVSAIEGWAKRQETVSTVMVFDPSPLYVAGPGSFGDELIRRAGGKNLVVEGGAYPTIDVERLLSLDPDVIIDAVGVEDGGASQLPKAPGWSELRAVKEGHVVRLASDAALRPGPRIADGLADVARTLHGGTPP